MHGFCYQNSEQGSHTGQADVGNDHSSWSFVVAMDFLVSLATSEAWLFSMTGEGAFVPSKGKYLR